MSERASELLKDRAGRQQDFQVHTRPCHAGSEAFPWPYLSRLDAVSGYGAKQMIKQMMLAVDAAPALLLIHYSFS